MKTATDGITGTEEVEYPVDYGTKKDSKYHSLPSTVTHKQTSLFGM